MVLTFKANNRSLNLQNHFILKLILQPNLQNDYLQSFDNGCKNGQNNVSLTMYCPGVMHTVQDTIQDNVRVVNNLMTTQLKQGTHCSALGGQRVSAQNTWKLPPVTV